MAKAKNKDPSAAANAALAAASNAAANGTPLLEVEGVTLQYKTKEHIIRLHNPGRPGQFGAVGEVCCACTATGILEPYYVFRFFFASGNHRKKQSPDRESVRHSAFPTVLLERKAPVKKMAKAKNKDPSAAANAALAAASNAAANGTPLLEVEGVTLQYKTKEHIIRLHNPGRPGQFGAVGEVCCACTATGILEPYYVFRFFFASGNHPKKQLPDRESVRHSAFPTVLLEWKAPGKKMAKAKNKDTSAAANGTPLM